MLKDRYGNTLSTTSQAARDAYIDAVDRLLAADEDVSDAFQQAIDEDENFGLAYIGLAREHQMRGEGHLVRDSVDKALATLKHATERETSHIQAMALLLTGKIPAAVPAIRAHLADHPRDAVVAQTCMGVFGLIGFSGQPGREAEQLAFTTSLAPHYGDDWWFLSQHAFAQLEVGQLGPAEKSIERSLEGNPRSGNGAHVRAHLYYENGESKAGYDYLDKWRRGFSRAALLHCHVNWHIALWALEQGDTQTMWHVLDTDILPEQVSGPPLNVVTDAASLLYRAEMAGIHVPPERWRAVSTYATEYFPKPGLAFADTHTALAHALAGNTDALAKIIRDARGPAADVVRQLAEAFGAIAGQRWSDAETHLSLAMVDHARIGGSRAQRDLVEFAMTSVLLKQGRSKDARLLLSLHRSKVATTSAIAALN